MFGYVKADKGEMRVWEYETYKAIYCSLCKQLGRTYGILTRFTLSYDFVFLALLQMSLDEKRCEVYTKHCTFNPLKKCKFCKDCDNELEYASAVAIIMVYYKILDGIEDSKGIKRLGYRLLKPVFGRKRIKAAKKYPKADVAISEYITEQSVLEKDECKDIDAICEPTSKALGRIFEMCAKENSDKRILSHLGYCMGKWIYIVDAAADLKKDMESGSYNVLKYGIKETDDVDEYVKEKALPVLNTCICNADLAFELLNIKKYKGILENILYLGLKRTQQTVFIKEKVSK